MTAVGAIAEGNLPGKGSVIGPLKSVCDECKFEKSEKKIETIKRIYELETIEEKQVQLAFFFLNVVLFSAHL